ncbi:nucleoside transporter-domain-containing protein, partial [Syncephalis pseudoplumigaleata]
SVFITASEYFTVAFSGGHFAGNFQNYFSISFCLINLIFVFAAMLRQHKANFPRQIVISHSINFAIFIIVIVLIKIPNIAPNTYFAIILVLMSITGITSSYLQNALYGLAARLPPMYVQGFLTGQGLAGLISSVVPLAIAFMSDAETASTVESVNRRAIIYFAFSAALVLLSIVTYLLMRQLPIYRYYNRSSKMAHQANAAVLQSYSRKDMLCVAQSIWKYGLAILLTLFVTLALFPSITASITSTRPNEARWRSREIFVLIHFVIFNAGDMLGKMLPALLPVRNDRALLLLSLLRMAFAPLFVLSNVQYGTGDLAARSTPVVFGDAVYYIILSVFSISNGWVGTCVMMFGPEKVAEPDRGYSGMMLSVLLTAGLELGSLASFAVRAGICNCNSFMS